MDEWKIGRIFGIFLTVSLYAIVLAAVAGSYVLLAYLWEHFCG